MLAAQKYAPLPVLWTGRNMANFQDGIDACVIWPNGKVYFFKENAYLRFDIAADRVDQNPRMIIDGWSGWPASWADGIQGAIVASPQRAYFFRGSEYLRYDIAADRVDQLPRPIAGYWPGWPADWKDGIDGCVNWGNGIVYFFKGANFIRYDLNLDRVTRDPTPIASAWGNWPFPWNARMNGGGVWPTGTAYLFSGPQYIRYSVAADAAQGAPASIVQNWAYWPGWVPPPPVLVLSAGTYTIKAKSSGKYLGRDIASYAANRASPGDSEKFTLKGNIGHIIDHLGAYLKGEVPTIFAPTVIPGNLWPSPTGEDGTKTQFSFLALGGNEFAIQCKGWCITADPQGLVSIYTGIYKDWETFILTKVS